MKLIIHYISNTYISYCYYNFWSFNHDKACYITVGLIIWWTSELLGSSGTYKKIQIQI